MHYETENVSLYALIQWGMKEHTARELAALPSPQEIDAVLGDTSGFCRRVLDGVRLLRVQRRGGRRLWRAVRKTLVAAAVLTSILFCSLMANASVRAAVVNTIIEWTDRAVGIQFEMTGTPLTNLPEGYGPHYIPEGMIYQDEVSWKVNDQISYSYALADGTSALDIQITVASNGSSYWMDNEHILYDRITFNGEMAYLGTFKDGTGYIMLWVKNGIENYIYYTGEGVSVSELYRIAENIC